MNTPKHNVRLPQTTWNQLGHAADAIGSNRSEVLRILAEELIAGNTMLTKLIEDRKANN